MLFNSYTFLFVFLPVVLVAWWSVKRPGRRLALLAVSNIIFYGWFDLRYLTLVVGIAAVDYLAGGRVQDERRGGLYLKLGIAANVLLLAVFKYANFVAVSGWDALHAAGYHGAKPVLGILLPVGVGFFTLNGISYLVDLRRGKAEPARSFIELFDFLAMFPHLVAGPIVRWPELRPQLRLPPRKLTAEAAAVGLFLLGLGLIEKLLVADQLAPTVDSYFSQPEELSFITGWAAAVGYTVQLFFDFAGYSDMAIGLALLLGFRFPQNFDTPLQARDIGDFWRRWHMTLGLWIRDYVFIPLGGSRAGPSRVALNLVIAMAIAGLWHGAGWTFVLWGVYHGVLLAFVALRRRARDGRRGNVVVGRVLTLGAVVCGFVVFRAPDLATAIDVFQGMAGAQRGWSGGLGLGASYVWVLAGALIATQSLPSSLRLAEHLAFRPRAAAVMGLATTWALLVLSRPTPFLYFQF